ncbi:hypothetical protein A2533_01315 [Candidatus Falkowbacteria bacterium RIFOXYD2_FULL_35_9]|nr:MAG: hypothetical protein A2533_01315 [Candidatus Falkowbacteria bacterium RIFOXYD2_FULL_35_9]
MEDGFMVLKSDDKIVRVGLESGSVESLFPDGYELLGFHSYNNDSKYFFLKQGADIFKFNYENQQLEKIDIIIHDYVEILPSADQDFKFIISDYSKSIEAIGMFDSFVLNQSYLYDARINETQEISGFESLGCKIFDSKNKKVYSWNCGEGVVGALPIKEFNFTGQELKIHELRDQINDSSEFQIFKNNNQVFVFNKTINKIFVANLLEDNFELTEYFFSDDAWTEFEALNVGNVYSIVIDYSQNKLFFGLKDGLLIMNFVNNEIKDSMLEKEENLYGNFIFIYDQAVYFKKNVREVNGEITSQIFKFDLNTKNKKLVASLKSSEEITILH